MVLLNMMCSASNATLFILKFNEVGKVFSENRYTLNWCPRDGYLYISLDQKLNLFCVRLFKAFEMDCRHLYVGFSKNVINECTQLYLPLVGVIDVSE